jgi:PAS domain S-box-containing protein
MSRQVSAKAGNQCSPAKLEPPATLFNQVLARISARLIKVDNEDLDAEILAALKDALEPLGVDRGGLLEVTEGSPVVKVSHIWCGEGIAPVSGQLNLVELFPWSYQHIILQGKDKVVANVADLPPEAEVDRQSLIQMGIKSAVTLPVFVGRRVHHLLSVNALKVERTWPDELIQGLHHLGEIFVSAVQRREANQALRFAESRLILAAASANAGFWDLDLESGVYWVTDKMREMFGFAPGVTLTREHSRQVIHPDDWGMVQETIAKAVSTGEEANVVYRAVLPNNQARWMHARGRIQRGLADGRLRLMGITQDVTERKQIELQLRDQLEEITRLRRQLEEENAYLRREAGTVDMLPQFSGSSQGMQTVMLQIEQVARTNSTVLILGETGTGKELVAQNIHRLSERGGQLMIKVNCAALPAALVESELFGREKGAFTGALSKQLGRFELANGSTLFLDEIAEMSLETQAKLLRVLQEGEFERLGSSRTIKVDVRVLAATNRDLEEEVRQGRFRRDLYYRLNVFPIHIPPLRDRIDDIPQIVWEFVKELGERMGKKIHRITKRDMEMLMRCPWPGNIRELRNVIEHALIISKGETLALHLSHMAKKECMQAATLEEVEREHIQAVLSTTHGRIKGPDGAAQRLGLKPSTLYSRIRKLGLQKNHS